MNKIIYNQHYFKSGENIVYQGEDTYPYSTKNILLVADGLGGRGGFPHKKILEHDDDILDKDKFYDKVFGKVFEVEADENLKEYILQAFNEIFETKDYYKLSNKTYRSSGYFASRLVSSIALYEIYNNSFLNVKKLFEDIEKEKEKYQVDDKQKEDQCSFKAIKKYAKTLSESIKEKLEEIADRVGFEIETSAGGAYLLPTTLAIALVNDSDDREDIDVVYLWAGDSRGYMWDKDGLAVLTDDHEKNETMTNLITLSQDFYIEGKMYNFKKPCILFNASDGCYKCPAFASPLDLEYIILDAFKKVDTSKEALDGEGDRDSLLLDKAINNLKDMFVLLSTHDDSNTMALSTYGYQTFEEIKKDVLDRLEYINENIIKELPGILERDYQGELYKLEDKMARGKEEVKRRLIHDDRVIDFVKGEVEKYQPLQDDKARLNAEKDEIYTKNKEAQGELEKLLKDNWLEGAKIRSNFVDSKPGKIFILRSDKAKDIEDLEEDQEKLISDYEKSVQKEIEKLEQKVENIKEKLEEISSFDEDSKEVLSKIDDIRVLLGKISIEGNYKDIYKDYNKNKEKITSLKVEVLQADEALINNIARDLLLEPDKFKLSDFGDVEEDVSRILDDKKDRQRRRQEIESEIKNLPDKYYEEYYRKDYNNLYKKLLEAGLISEQYISEEKLSDEDSAKYEEIKKCLEKRHELYKEYQENYERFWK